MEFSFLKLIFAGKSHFHLSKKAFYNEYDFEKQNNPPEKKFFVKAGENFMKQKEEHGILYML
ncbi:hypothetical protein QJV03_09845 [Listeria swaminathanii]|uniref:hypothetical protein n=1 Tax=Listeria swaminathanii TaxID=2713501 RepID=UPI00287FF4E5|nr:hypothetical protein [Listeria swaminathanii]MDT0017482.1 hypothetical protein [Listeria swaminathanii]